jgi:hypothetical protein
LKIIKCLVLYNTIFSIDSEMATEYGQRQRVNYLSEKREQKALNRDVEKDYIRKNS